MRKTVFQNGNYYHLYNRGVDKRELFCDEKDYVRFLRSMKEFNQVEPIGSLYLRDYNYKAVSKGVGHPIGCPTPKSALVELICYCLNPNHYHLLLKQIVEDGISEFMKRLGGYTSYFNKKNKRSGSLFEGSHKAVAIKTDEQLAICFCLC